MIKTVGTIIGYGPDDQTVTKFVASVLNKRTDDVLDQKKWQSLDGGDLRANDAVAAEMAKFFKRYKVANPICSPQVLGCPHEEGIDYPLGTDCPQCPFWKGKDRWDSSSATANFGPNA